MDTIGLDWHKRESQLCIITEDGELIERRIITGRAAFAAVLGSRPRARILLEASTESEWVARHLESLGHAVIVADPGFAPMYATRSKKVKTDKRDARALCEACQVGAYRAIHRVSDAQRHVRADLAVRDALVRTRTRYVAIIKAFVRREGLRLRSGEPEHTVAKLAELPLPAPLLEELTPLVSLMAPVNAQIAHANTRLTALADTDPIVPRLRTVPGVGPVTAVAFIAALDDITRFHNAHQVQAYLGLVPSEYSSGERQLRVASPNAATRASAGCSSRPDGACCGRMIPRPHLFGRGLSASRFAGVSGSRWSHSRAAWQGFSSPFGATIRPITCRGPAWPRKKNTTERSRGD